MEHISKAKPPAVLENQNLQPIRLVSECACGGSGWLRFEGGVQRCHCAKRRLLDAKLAVLPARYRGCCLGNYVPRDGIQEQGLIAVQEHLGDGLFLWGNYGRGKTHLAVAQYRALVEAGESVQWRSMSELLTEIQRAAVKDEFSIVLERVRHAGSFHLFIDDIDKFKPTEFKAEALFDLFDTLWRRNLKVTVTSNWSLTQLTESEMVHPAIVRRLDDMCMGVRL